MPWFKSGELNDNPMLTDAQEFVTEKALHECSLRLDEPGDVLIAMYGATIGRVAILGCRATTNQAVCACSCSEAMSNRYLFILLQALRPVFWDQGAGAAQPNISKIKIVSTIIPLPPFAEQKRIVAKVDELMKRCDALAARQQARNERRTVLVSACLHALTTPPEPPPPSPRQPCLPGLNPEHRTLPATAKRREVGTPEPNPTRSPDFILQPLTFSLLFDTPETVRELRQTILQLAVQGRLVPQDAGDRRLVNLRDVSARIHYGYTASADPAITEMRLLRITDIQDNDVHWDSVPGCEIDDKDVPKYELHPGDILIARTGGTIGKTYLITETPVRAVFASYLIRVIPSERVLPPYLKLFLESPDYWEQLRMKSAGTGQPNVNGQALGSLEFVLPPLPEQKLIVAEVNELMALCDALEAKLSKTRAGAETLAAAVVHHLGSFRRLSQASRVA